MKYSNIVRCKVKEGKFEEVVKKLTHSSEMAGLEQNTLVRTGENTLCSIGIWESEEHIANARTEMIQLLDTIRDDLETLSEELGVTDPVSGPIIFHKK